MRVAMASVAAGRPGRVNEDFAAALPSAAVLVDGAGIPGSEAVCRHGVAWYASRLGGTLLGLLSHGGDRDPATLKQDDDGGDRDLAAQPRGGGRDGDPATLPQGGDGGGRDLPALLAEAIAHVTDLHRHTCDVADPISPSAAVGIVRVGAGRVDHLVLGDCVVALDRVDGAPVVVDDRREVVIARSYADRLRAVEAGGAAYQRLLRDLRAHRNRAGGFWVAKDDPRAAYEAVTGSHPVAGLAGAALLSNGASRIVDTFGLTDWPGALALLASDGPAAVIDRVRVAEARRTVAADDATVVYCTDLA